MSGSPNVGIEERSRVKKTKRLAVCLSLGMSLCLGGCSWLFSSDDPDSGASSGKTRGEGRATGVDKAAILGKDQGGWFSFLSSGPSPEAADLESKSAIGINGFLWRATLDTIAFMPLASADPFGGVIITEWYSAADTPDERVKLTVYILDRRLRADGVRVSVFKQVRQGDQWLETAIGEDTAARIENAILTRARQMRIDVAG